MKIVRSLALVAVVLVATGPIAARRGDLQVRVERVTSSSVTVAWTVSPEVKAVRVYVSPEPADRSDVPLPDQHLVGRLPASLASYTLNGVAAATHVFLRVEFDTGQARSLGQTVHAYTSGGPRATLDSPLREVHAYAPDVLMLVLENRGTRFDARSGSLQGNLGASWQAGRWTVRRRDGRPIGVRAVHRHSIPVGQPDYQVGFGGPVNNDVVDVDHRVFLVLEQPIDSRELLHVTHSGDAGTEFAVMVPFSDRYLETPVIQLNQVGYNPRATKRWAYLSGWMGDGGPLYLGGFPDHAEVLREPGSPLDPRDVVVTSKIEPRSRLDQDAGSEVRQIDLAGVPADEDATYRVRIPGVGVSWRTQVSEVSQFRSFYVVARGLFHNRWAGDLRPEYTDWPRPPDHTTVYTAEQQDALSMFPRDTPRVGPRELRGGYHDAGDFDQRPMHTEVARMLMAAYELHPHRYSDGQLTIPESGNGIPDLLDEALWGLRTWEQLQEADGGVRGGVESYRHPNGYHLANEDQLPYWTFARNPNVTARAAGLFAQASRLLASLDRARSEGLRRHAELAFRWAKQNQAKDAFLMFAAGELYRLTRSIAYRDAFERALAKVESQPVHPAASAGLAPAEYESGTRYVVDYVLPYLLAGDGSSDIRQRLLKTLDWAADEAAQLVLDSPHAHRSARPLNYRLGWGQSSVPGGFLYPIVARLRAGGLQEARRQRFFDALSLGADYVLGGNPLGMTFLTGLGSRRPEEPLHLDSLVFIKRGGLPMPGIPVYGPVDDLPGAPYYRPGQAAFHPPFDQHPPMLRYGDVRTFVVNTEFTVWEVQAPHTAHFAALIAPGMVPPPPWAPGRDLRGTR